MAKTSRQVKQFEATAGDGTEYTIVVYQDFVSLNTRAGAAEVPGMKTLYTNGKHVNRIAKGQYEIVESGKKLLSTDPNAE